MPNPPAFQFYAAEYLADEKVSLMSLEEEGAYWRAVAYCWREGSIPADSERLSRLLKGASNQTLTVVRNCFNQMATDASRLIHPRLEMEREKQRIWREKSSAAGKASGKARRKKKLSTEPMFRNGSTKPEPNTNSSSLSLSSSSNTPKSPTGVENDISPEMVAQGVMQELGIGGSGLLRLLTDICKRKLQDTPPDKLRDDLVSSWVAYKKAIPRLLWCYSSPEKFFAGDLWPDSTLWPWKEGHAAPKPATSRRYANANAEVTA